jgi:hypothetical protein
MKFLFVLLFSIGSIWAARIAELHITKAVDDMTDKAYVFSSENLIVTEDGKNGASMFVSYDDELNIKFIHTTLLGYGCVEGVKMIVLFEDGSKFTLESNSEFSCDGSAFFHSLSEVQESYLATKLIKKIRFINGRNFASVTSEVSLNKDYFIRLANAVKANNVRVTKR